MIYPAVFQAGRGAPFTDEFQDMIREHMIARLPPVPDIKPERKPYTKSDESFRLRRKRMEPFVLEQRAQGATIEKISSNFGISERTVSRILKEAEYQGAPPTVLPPLSAPARLCGRIDQWQPSRAEDRAEWVAKQAEAGYTTSQIAQALNVSKSAVVRIVGKGKEAA